MKDINRIKILNFLKWNDKNGAYTDEDRYIEGIEKMTYNDAIKYFYSVVNDDIYYKEADNIFELTFEEVKDIAVKNDIVNSTENKLEILLKAKNNLEDIYRNLV